MRRRTDAEVGHILPVREIVAALEARLGEVRDLVARVAVRRQERSHRVVHALNSIVVGKHEPAHLLHLREGCALFELQAVDGDMFRL